VKKKKNQRIIYIDGDKKYQKMAKKVFAKEGYNISICSNGEEGLMSISKGKPGVVIIDYNLGDITIEEFYTRFLTDKRFKKMYDIPFIALVNNGDVDKSKLYSLGFSRCFSKPFYPSQLLDFVEDVLISHNLRMEEYNFWDTIHDAKDFLENVVESSVDPIVTTDTRGIITYCNAANEEMLGYSFEELVGQRASIILHEGASELLKIASFLKKNKKLRNYKTYAIKKDGKKIPLNLSMSLMRNGGGRVIGVIAIGKEMSGDESIEYDAQESDRLATIVETAVAVNHAINNPLVPILGNAQFLLQNENIVDEDIKKRLRVIVNNALRIRDITQKLARVTHPVTREYSRGTRMLDIDASAF